MRNMPTIVKSDMIQKKLHRFLIDAIPPQTTFTITDKRVVHQLLQVLKVKPGETFILFSNESADQIVEIVERTKDTCTVQVLQEIQPTHDTKNIVVCISITKGATFEIAVQKLTELGVSEIVPLIALRTVKQGVRLDRLQTISDEALEQSGGNKRVLIHSPMSISECLSQFPFPSAVLHPATDRTIKDNKLQVLYVGPEGGWSNEDMHIFEGAHNVTYLSLGARILRTETAAIVGAYELLRK